jgi:phosphate/sulfate permease
LGSDTERDNYTPQETIEVFDHDWPTLATGVAISHGLNDIRDNVGYIQISSTHHTSELPCDLIPYWWNTYGKVPDHGPNSILL